MHCGSCVNKINNKIEDKRGRILAEELYNCLNSNGSHGRQTIKDGEVSNMRSRGFASQDKMHANRPSYHVFFSYRTEPTFFYFFL